MARRTIPVVEPAQLIPLSYDRNTFLEEIKTKYGSDASGWTSITLGRKDSTGKFSHLRSYLEPPSLDDIKAEWGGGEYRLFLQYKIENAEDDGDPRKLSTQFFSIAGPPVNPWEQKHQDNSPANNNQSNSAAAPSTNVMMEAFTMAEKIISLTGGSRNNNNGGGSDMTAIANILAKSKESETTLLTTLLPLILKKDDAGYKDLLETMLKNRNESTPLGDTLKIVDAINDRAASMAPKDEGMGESLVKGLLPMLTGGGGAPGASNEAGGAAAGVPAWANGLMAEIRAGFTNMGNKIDGIDKRVKEIEDVYWVDDPESPGKVVEMEEHNNKPAPADQQPAQLTEEQIMFEKQAAEMLKSLPDQDKVKQLNDYIGKWGVPAVYDWCIQYGAVDNLEEFNRIMQLAGHPEHVPADVK